MPYRNSAEPDDPEAPCGCALWAVADTVSLDCGPHHSACPHGAVSTPAEIAKMVADWYNEAGEDVGPDELATAIAWAIRHRAATVAAAQVTARTRECAAYAEALAAFWKTQGREGHAAIARVVAAGILALDALEPG